ncbi:MAG: NUDIX domain-containing protein [Bacteroidota bacterium]|nr:NUDIX domain-containing protein [Bacteroidota bacterium]MDP3434553.1 NUDIX domain-containing protein [Bacteroidota bacterium]
MIDVCCAFILKESKILAVQRGPESSHPWKWEFPGGKINSGETAEESIIREIEEELTIRIEVLNQLVPVEFDYTSRFLFCQIWKYKYNSNKNSCPTQN